jgi:disulfide bond formation protein DsbB
VSSREDPMILFFALLAVLCHVFLVTMAVLWLMGAVSPAMRVRRRAVVRALSPVAAPFAFAVATVTMAGSLYLSEVKHYIPCHLCWIQRALLYPQVLFTALLTFRPQWNALRRFAVGALVVDIPVSTYHYLLQKYPDLETSSCDFDNPCTQRYIDLFGYISEPGMALTAALTILTLLLIQKGMPALEMLIWTATAGVTLCILLFVSSDAWAIAPLPLIVFAVLTFVERRRAQPTA